MSKTTDSDLIKGFLEGQSAARKPMIIAIINSFEWDNFVQQALLVSNSDVDTTDPNNPIHQTFKDQKTRIGFYIKNRIDCLNWLSNSTSRNDKSMINHLSMIFWGDKEADSKEIERVFISNDMSSNHYERLVDIFMMNSIENTCQCFHGFMTRYRSENEFFDIDIKLTDNLTPDAKRLLLSDTPSLTVMNDGSVQDVRGVIPDKHKTLEDIIYLIKKGGYNDGYLARNEEEGDDYEN